MSVLSCLAFGEPVHGFEKLETSDGDDGRGQCQRASNIANHGEHVCLVELPFLAKDSKVGFAVFLSPAPILTPLLNNCAELPPLNRQPAGAMSASRQSVLFSPALRASEVVSRQKTAAAGLFTGGKRTIKLPNAQGRMPL
jgi:hypothetical protein